MSGAKKPRRPRWLPTAETMKLATLQAAKPPKEHVDQILGSMRAAHKALREGVATVRQWGILAGSVALAKAIHELRVVRDIDGHRLAAAAALEAVYLRSQSDAGWKQDQLSFDELDALDTFTLLHKTQLENLGRAEFFAAVDRATGQMRAAGDTVSFHSDPVPLARMAA